MKEILIRRAGAADCAAICAIYNQGIEDRVATLEAELHTLEERLAWLRARGPRQPVLVATRAGVIVGWCSLNRFNPRACYDHVADISIYIERAERGRGVGRALMAALEAEAHRLRYHKLVLAMFPHNAAGRALYGRAGFREVGVYREQGLLNGTWVDVLIMEKLLTDGAP